MQGDEFTQYVRKYSDMVYRVAYSCTHSAPDSEDIMQDVLLKLYICEKKFHDDEHVKAWLIRVAVNRSRDVLRSVNKKRTEELREGLSVSDEEPSSDLHTAMAGLSRDHRLVIYLFYYEGYSVKEISKILRITESNVKTRLKRAREKLRAFLNDE